MRRLCDVRCDFESSSLARPVCSSSGEACGDEFIDVGIKYQADVGANYFAVGFGIVIDTEAPVNDAVLPGIDSSLGNVFWKRPLKGRDRAARTESGIAIRPVWSPLAGYSGPHKLGGLQYHRM